MAPFCLFFAFALYQFIVWGPIAKKMKVPLQSEFELIAPLPNSEPIDYNLYSKPALASISTDYKSSENALDIFTYYETVLNNQGWHYFTDRRNYKDTERIYCKGEYTASLHVYDNQQYHGYKYSIWFEWGSSQGCPIQKGTLTQLEAILNWQFIIVASLAWIIYAVITKYSNNILARKMIFILGLYGLSLSIYNIAKLVLIS